MPRISAVFFAFGTLCLLVGLTMGMAMGGSGDFTLMPAHAHLNLLGFVVMAIYGGFYALTRESLSPRLAWINFALSAAGVLVMIPALALSLASGTRALEPVIGLGGGLCMLGALVFAVSVFREVARTR